MRIPPSLSARSSDFHDESSPRKMLATSQALSSPSIVAVNHELALRLGVLVVLVTLNHELTL